MMLEHWREDTEGATGVGRAVGPWPRAAAVVPALVFFGLALIWLALLPFPDAFALFMAEETGIVENGTVLLCAVGAVVAWRLFARPERLAARWQRWWFLSFVGGLAFIGGEEISWGQHWFGWVTPEEYARLNIQRETNLHNLSKWAERLPKNLLSIAVLVTGLVWPLALQVAPRALPSLPSWLDPIWPAPYLWPAAAITFGLRLAERIPDWLAVNDDQLVAKSLKEGVEIFLVLFVVLYLFDVWFRARARRASVRRRAAMTSRRSPRSP